MAGSESQEDTDAEAGSLTTSYGTGGNSLSGGLTGQSGTSKVVSYQLIQKQNTIIEEQRDISKKNEALRDSVLKEIKDLSQVVREQMH